MLNYQGQQLTPTERALNRAAPGFATMLAGVQQYANRVEENRRIAGERQFQIQRDTTQFSRQIELLKEGDALQTARELELQKQRAASNQADIALKAQADLALQDRRTAAEQENKIFEMQLQASPLGVAATSAQSQARFAGGELPKFLLETQSELQRNIQDHRTRYAGLPEYSVMMNPETATPVYQRLDPQSGWVMSSPEEYNFYLAQASEATRIATSVDSLLQTPDLPAQIRSKLVALQGEIRSGKIPPNEAISMIQSSVSDVDLRAFDRDVVQQTNETMRRTANDVFSVITQNTPESARLIGALPNNRFLATSDVISTDPNIVTTLVRVTDPEQAKLQLAAYIRNNFASVTDLISAAESRKYQNKDATDPLFALHTNLRVINSQRTSGNLGESVFFNPFAPANSTNTVTDANRLADSIYQAYKSGQIRTIPTNEQMVGPFIVQ
jgi:hypothetical protein